MPTQPAVEPSTATLELVITASSRDLGDGFVVRRALPSPLRRMVGPFIFVDHMGPVAFGPGQALDVRPHPHIGLATLTYLFEGEIMHRDSLGTVQAIRPGEVNWMTAGRGIVHSERTPPELRNVGASVHGMQCWLALPKAHEEAEPSFVHYDAQSLPHIEGDGLHVRVIAGEVSGWRSPVKTVSQTLYADVAISEGAAFELPTGYDERALYVAVGSAVLDGQTYAAGQLVVVRKHSRALLKSAKGAGESRIIVFGGEPMDGPRHVWWNFVSSSETRMQQAKEDWKAGRFPSVPGETEFIPLPEEPAKPVAYP